MDEAAHIAWGRDEAAGDTGLCRESFLDTILVGFLSHWALRDDLSVRVTGRGILDVTVWQQKRSMAVHLVNLTNPMMMKGPFRELIPLTDQAVQIRLPGGKKATEVSLLVAGKSPEYQLDGGHIKLVVNEILDHEVIAVDLA